MKCPHCQEELGLNNICINPACSYFSTTIQSSENSNLSNKKININNTEINLGNNLNNENINSLNAYNYKSDTNSPNSYNNGDYTNNGTINKITDNSHNIYDNNNISIEELAAFIGSNNTNYYLKYVNKMHSNSKFTSWNWPCFFLGSYWLLYRKVYSLGVILIALNFMSSLIFDSGIPAILALTIRIILTLFANTIYLNTCKHKIKTIKANIKNLSTTQYINKLREKGGVTWVAPLVLVGIYMIVVIISIITFILFAVTENEPNFSSPYYQY